MMGFIWAAIAGMQKPISMELQRFIRREQMRRLKALIKKKGKLIWGIM